MIYCEYKFLKNPSFLTKIFSVAEEGLKNYGSTTYDGKVRDSDMSATPS
jgi:hypothetical protein